MHSLRTAFLVILAVLLLAPVIIAAGSDPERPADSASTDSLKLKMELLTILGDGRRSQRNIPGRWRQVREAGSPHRRSDEEEERITELVALPYLQGYKKAPKQVSVTIYESSVAYPGINLFTSGHGPQAIAMDMKGKVLHSWQYQAHKIWPDLPATAHDKFWRRAYWYPNGDILAIFEGIGLIKLDKDSNLLWAFRGGCHHEVFVTEGDMIYVLTRKAEMIPSINKETPVLHDGIAVLDSCGEVMAEYSILECFENSDYVHLLERMPTEGDLFHTNSLYVFDGTTEETWPVLKKGNVMVSVMKLHMIAIVDLEAQKVVWAQSGRGRDLWKRQHDPQILPNGNILVFDNHGRHAGSRIVEFDPVKDEIVWQYPTDDQDPFSSKTCGTSRLLPNGNILITESDNGRAIEITRGGEVVWEFFNPHRAGANSELIATLFELVRVERDYFTWLR